MTKRLKKTIITCKLTGIEDWGVKAHIIPQALYRLEGKPGFTYTLGKGKPRMGRMPNGVYDSTILVAEGERHFSTWDDYAAKFFLNRRRHNDGKTRHLFLVDDKPAYAELGPGLFSPDLLRLFCMSVLWRAGVSNKSFFSQIQLGEHEERLRSCILSKTPGAVTDFSVILWRYADTPTAGWPMSNPRMITSDGITFCRFMLPDIIFDVKLSHMPLPESFNILAVGGTEQLVIAMNQNYRDTNLFNELVTALGEIRQNR